MIKAQTVKYNSYASPIYFQSRYNKSLLHNRYRDSFIKYCRDLFIKSGTVEKIIKVDNDPFPVSGLTPVVVETEDAIDEIVALVNKIENEEFKCGWSLENYKNRLKKNLKNPNSLLMAVRDSNNKIVGTGIMLQCKDNTGYINGFYLDKEYRGKGIGKWMMRRIFEKAECLKLSAITLHAKNPDAINLYKKSGFKNRIIAGEVNGEPIYLMIKALHLN